MRLQVTPEGSAQEKVRGQREREALESGLRYYFPLPYNSMELASYGSRRGLRDDLDHFFKKQIRGRRPLRFPTCTW